MSMYNLTRQVAPATSALTDTVRGIASIPLGIAEQVATPLVNIPQQYPNLTKAVGGLSRIGMGMGGDPLAATKMDYYKALGGARQFDMNQSQRFDQAMQQVYQMIPDFNPANEAHYQAALGIVMQTAGPEAAIDFAGQFEPNDRSDLIRQVRNDYAKTQEEVDMVEGAYRLIMTIGDGPISAPTLLTAYAKLLDPGSVVREGEQRVLQRAGGLSNRIISYLNEADEGQLPPALKADIQAEATKLYNQKMIVGTQRRDDFRNYATGPLGLAEEEVDLMMGRSAPLPVAYLEIQGENVTPSNIDDFEERPGGPTVEFAEGEEKNGRVLWDKKSGTWVFVEFDPSAPYGISIYEIEDD